MAKNSAQPQHAARIRNVSVIEKIKAAAAALGSDEQFELRPLALRNGAGRQGGDIVIVAPETNQRLIIVKNGLAIGY